MTDRQVSSLRDGGPGVAEVERLLRREWWLHHGCDLPALYGDDGEMQCHACRVDFKREPIQQLHAHVDVKRFERARAALDA